MNFSLLRTGESERRKSTSKFGPRHGRHLRKTSGVAIATSILLNPLGTIGTLEQPAAAADVTVLVWSDPDFDTATDICNNESTVLRTLIEGVDGFTVDASITDMFALTASELRAKLDTAGFFFVPDIETPTLASVIDSAREDVLRDWVRDGGVLVQTGTGGTKDADLVNQIFDFTSPKVSSVVASTSATWNRTSDAVGTPFELGPSSIPYVNQTEAFNGTGIAGFKAIYGSVGDAAVATISYGEGTAILLGYDFFSGGPTCSYATSAWAKDILPNSLKYAAQLSKSGLDNPTTEGGTLSYTFSSTGTAYYAVLARTATAPNDGSAVKTLAVTKPTGVFAAGSSAITGGVEKQFVISGLSSATSYTVYVATEYGTSAFSSVQKVDFSTLPGVPIIGSITSGDGSITVPITKASNETNFEYSLNNGSTWVTRSPASTATAWVIPGLTNGTSYDFKFRSVFDSQVGAATETFTVIPAALPSLPQNLAVTFGEVSSATVSWTAPASTGGSAIMGYVVEYNDGSTWKAVTPTGTTAVISDVWVNQNWSFRVAASNANGTGSFATYSHLAPATSVTQSLGSEAETSAVLSYQFNYSGTGYWIVVPRGSAAPTAEQVVAGATYGAVTVVAAGTGPVVANTQRTFELTGLSSATQYTVYTASEYLNPVNDGTFLKLTPAALNFSTLPGVPVVASLTSGDQQVSAAITKASNETNFEYSVDGGSTWITRSPASTASPWVISGLTNGATYSFKFRSVFDSKVGAASAASSIIPAAFPDAPQTLAVSFGESSGASVSWQVPTNDGGLPVTAYVVEYNDGSGWETVTATGTSAEIPELWINQNWSFRVAASNANGTGSFETYSHSAPATAVSQSMESVSADGGVLSYTFNYSGTCYWIVVPRGSAAPTADQVLAGVSYGAVTVSAAGNDAVVANIDKVLTISGLAEATEYTAYTASEYLNPVNDGSFLKLTPTALDFASLPGVPTVASVTSGNQEISVSITSSSNETNFEYSPDGGNSWIARSPASTESPWVISGLANGASYDFKFRSVFESQAGEASETFSIIPADAPGLAEGLSVSFGAVSGATVSWEVPTDDGGLPVAGYVVEFDDGSGWQAVTATGNSASIPTAWINQNWSFRVAASNANGTGAFTTYSHTSPVPAVMGTPDGPSTLVTEEIQNEVTSIPGQANAVSVSGGVITPKSVSLSRVTGNTPTDVQTEINNIVTSFDSKWSGGGSAPRVITPVDTQEGAKVFGLLADPISSEPVGIPAKDVILVTTANEAVMLAAISGDKPAEVTPEGVLVVSQGSTLGFAIHGFAPNTQGELVLMSSPLLLGTFTTDANGSFIGQATLPTGIGPGNHSAVLSTSGLVTSIGISLLPAPSVPGVSRPYEGPLNIRLQSGEICSGADLVITGERLNTVASIEVSGRDAAFTRVSDERVRVSLDGVRAGKHEVRLFVPISGVQLTSGLIVRDCDAALVSEKSGAAKVNIGTFNGKIVVYAKGMKGSTLTWKIAGKWQRATVTKDFQLFDRRTSAIGLPVKVETFVNGGKPAAFSKTVVTK